MTAFLLVGLLVALGLPLKTGIPIAAVLFAAWFAAPWFDRFRR